jgi:UDP-N-acetylmuramoyl-L-alanyl-D-glutamate--2,6-diaminopimelate ligase
MKLKDLTRALGPQLIDGTASGVELEIGSIHYRSKDVRPNGLFVAIAGSKADGHDFISDAVSRGASAVVVAKPVKTGVETVQVADTRQALSTLAHRFFGEPSEELVVIGITGTNGKTTVSYLVESILAAAGKKTGVIGTINFRFDGQTFDNPVTTPESLELHQILRRMADAGVTHVVMEVSSHAMAMHRVDHCRLDVGVFTNLSQDHLDYHGTMDAYWACKKGLFTDHLVVGPKKDRAVAVVNRSQKWGRELFDILPTQGIAVGSAPEDTIRLEDAGFDLKGVSGILNMSGGRIDFESPLVGRHNLENILCAAGAASALGIPLDRVRAGIEALAVVRGRLEPVPNDHGIFVYVDYAHTPDALKNALASVKELARGRVICIFGCGGDRDKSKRPQMGVIATRLSDLAVVTSDNPRSESPEAIIEDIVAGIPLEPTLACTTEQAVRGAFDTPAYTVEPDRRMAIGLGIQAACPGDTVLIAGKGHETYQILGRETISFDDKQVAAAFMAADRKVN